MELKNTLVQYIALFYILYLLLSTEKRKMYCDQISILQYTVVLTKLRVVQPVPGLPCLITGTFALLAAVFFLSFQTFPHKHLW